MKCKCGEKINDFDFDFTGGSSDTGEEFYKWQFTCRCCEYELSGSEWGDFEYTKEAYDELIKDVAEEINSYDKD